MNLLYKYRGIIAGILGILLLMRPPACFELACGIFAALLFLIAIFLRIWARMYIGQHSRGSELVCPEIVSTGPYKHIKHPLYISNFMAGAAFAFFHAGFSATALGFCLIYGFFMAILAKNENKFLKEGKK